MFINFRVIVLKNLHFPPFAHLSTGNCVLREEALNLTLSNVSFKFNGKMVIQVWRKIVYACSTYQIILSSSVFLPLYETVFYICWCNLIDQRFPHCGACRLGGTAGPWEGGSCLYKGHKHIHFGRHFALLKCFTYHLVLVLALNYKQHILSPAKVSCFSMSQHTEYWKWSDTVTAHILFIL
jgi:hypothetical protein